MYDEVQSSENGIAEISRHIAQEPKMGEVAKLLACFYNRTAEV